MYELWRLLMRVARTIWGEAPSQPQLVWGDRLERARLDDASARWFILR